MSDKVPRVGDVIWEYEIAHRDCIHVAVAPVVASETLKPGEWVALNEQGEAFPTTYSGAIGVVDPFLVDSVEKGFRFWLFLKPGTITNLRHTWTHTSFKPKIPELKDE